MLQTKSLWRNREFLILETGQTLSTLGTSISSLIFLLLVLAITKSPAQAGFVASTRTLPFFILALPAGAWIDRWNRKKVMIYCDIVRALSLLSVPIALAIGHLTIFQLYCNALVEGVMYTFFNIAASSSLKHMVAKNQLTSAMSVDYATDQAASLVGPPIGTFLYSLLNMLPFLADALSYLISILSLLTIQINFQIAREQKRRVLHKEIGEGFTFLWKNAILRQQMLIGIGRNIIFGSVALLITVLAQYHHTNTLLIGFAFTVTSLGGTIGSFLSPSINKHLSFGQIMISRFWIEVLLWLCYLFAANFLLIGIVTAGLFFVESVGSVVNISYRLAITPDEFQGRVNSIHRLGTGAGLFLGPTLAGISFQLLGPTTTILLFAALLFILAFATTLNKAAFNIAEI